jgi:hypothetical protein
MFFNLPSKKRQLTIISIAIVGYLIFVVSGSLLLPDIGDKTKKILTQTGLVFLYFAALLAGLPFVWSAKARHNLSLANEIIKRENILIERIISLPAEEHGTYTNQIEAAKQDIKNSKHQIELANEELPKFYEWCGAFSLVLVFLGTLVCIIGAS